MNTIIQNSRRFLWLIALIGLIQSCTKTEYTDYETEPRNHILEYRVANSKQELLGAINNESNTITVYIPYYVGFKYLNAEIKIDEGAKLLDSTGTEINLDGGIDPVAVGAGPIKYTVVSAEGETRNYSLIQKVLPHGEALQATYVGMEDGQTRVAVPVNYSNLVIKANFESAATNAKFFLTDKATGRVYDNFIQGQEMTIGTDGYALRVAILPEALAGEYSVRMEHQGRSADLPDLKLNYTKVFSANGNLGRSAATYTPGDTVVLDNPSSTLIEIAGIFLPIERVYFKIRARESFTPMWGGPFSVPAGFPEALYDTEIPVKIVSQSRSQLKLLFPDIPDGQYLGCGWMETPRPYPVDADGIPYALYLDTNFGFYADYEASTGFGKGHLFAKAGSIRFTVLKKQ